MSKPAPRVAGRGLQVLASLLRAPISGPALARVLAAKSIEEPIASLDLAAEGDPAPYYMPPPYEAEKAGGDAEGSGGSR